MTKYVLSLWQVYDYSLDDMLLEVARKNSVMRARLKQEFSDLPKSERVLLVDIDGTLADLRYGLWELALLKGLVDEALVEPQTLNPDVDFGIDYRKFQALKQEFTENHGYFHLRPLRAACDAVRRLAKSGTKVIAYTARPADKYPSLWLETLSWLDDQDLPVAGLYIGSDVRIKLMLDLIDRGCDVVLFDDDPETIGRALNSGIKCVVPKYPYNAAYWRRNHVYAVDARHGQIVFPFSERDGNVPDEKEIKAIPE